MLCIYVKWKNDDYDEIWRRAIICTKREERESKRNIIENFK